jgi:integrase
MATNDHNKPDKGTEPAVQWGEIQTLGDLRNYVLSCGLPGARRDQIRSAIKRADELIGYGALDVAADAKLVLGKMEEFSPAMAGMSTAAFANLKSRLRYAFRLAAPHIKPARSSVALAPVWFEFCSHLDERSRRALSRFARFATAGVFLPGDIADEHLERFRVHLDENLLHSKAETIVRGTIRAWNKASESREGFRKLTPLPVRRVPYWVNPEEFPESLQADITRFLHDLSHPSIFGGQTNKTPRLGTIEQYSHAIRTLVSTLAHDGVPLSELNTLGSVIQPEYLNRALMFLHRRFGGRATPGMEVLVGRARKMARWCTLPAEQLESIDRIVAQVREAIPRTRKYAKKHEPLVAKLDEQNFCGLLMALPYAFREKAQRLNSKRYAISYARAALAIELLLTCGMRRENLVELELGKTIRMVGAEGKAIWIIDIPQEDVKNAEPLHYSLPEESAVFLEDYLKNWRLLICNKPSPWLFPNKHGGPINPKVMTTDICAKTKRELGIKITPHQFRHLSAELYVRGGGEMETVSEHLGHRDLNTTRNYYLKPRQRQASRRYQEKLIAWRADSQGLGKHKRIRKYKSHQEDVP